MIVDTLYQSAGLAVQERVPTLDDSYVSTLWQKVDVGKGPIYSRVSSCDLMIKMKFEVLNMVPKVDGVRPETAGQTKDFLGPSLIEKLCEPGKERFLKARR